jgi:hypothetical protein
MVTVQFTIPRSVANQLDTRAIIGQARDLGLAMPSLELNDKDAGPSNTRVTCRDSIAVLVVNALRALAAKAEQRQDSDELRACAIAVKNAMEAIADANKANKPLPSGPAGFWPGA